MRRGIVMIVALLVAAPVGAQTRDNRDTDPDPDVYGYPQDQPPRPAVTSMPIRTGRTANAGSGEVGQRQTREEAAPNIEPLGRIESRIANRVQSRIRNRIDRDYNPQANATSPFIVADDQARTAGRPTRR